jgi:hypothetical protein
MVDREAQLPHFSTADPRTAMTNSGKNAVVAALTEMGISPGTLPCTFSLSEGRLVAQKFFFEGGYAVWATGSGTLRFFDDDGKLLRSVGVCGIAA